MVTMTYRQRRRLLQALIGLLAAGLLWPMGLLLSGASVSAGAEGGSSKPPSHLSSETVRLPAPLESYAVIHGRDIRRPLVDPAPPAPPPAVRPKLTIVLEGTVVEVGHNYAFIRTAGGQTQIIREGQTVDNAEIVSINEDNIVVRFGGEEITLGLPEEEGAAR